jgi:Bacteriophage protein of unknown function (DUF646).
MVKIVPIVPISALIHSIVNVKVEVPNASRRVLQQAGKVFVDDAKKHVHTITGKTRESIQAKTSNEHEIDITMRYGALYEIRRPGSKPPPRQGRGTGPHNFLDHALKITADKLPKIVDKEITSLFKKNRR